MPSPTGDANSTNAAPDDLAARCAAAQCRSCGHSGLRPVLDLGRMPLTAAFVSEQHLNEAEPRYPLEVGFCARCTLVQVLETIAPTDVFHSDYPYYSSFSDTMLAHASDLAQQTIQLRRLSSQSLVIELASND